MIFTAGVCLRLARVVFLATRVRYLQHTFTNRGSAVMRAAAAAQEAQRGNACSVLREHRRGVINKNESKQSLPHLSHGSCEPSARAERALLLVSVAMIRQAACCVSWNGRTRCCRAPAGSGATKKSRQPTQSKIKAQPPAASCRCVRHHRRESSPLLHTPPPSHPAPLRAGGAHVLPP